MINKFFTTIVVCIILDFFTLIPSFSQVDPPIVCKDELSNVEQFMKINLPEHANYPWRLVFKHCPSLSKNIYIIGADIYSEKIEKTKDTSLQRAYCDTLMMIYDQRIKYFSEEGRVLGYKGLDMIRYNRSGGNETMKSGYENLKKSIELENEKSTPAVLTTFVSVSINLFINKEFSNEQVVNDYISVMKIIDTQLEKGPSSKTQRAKDIINTIVKENKIFTCESVVSVFTPRFESNKDNIEFLKLVSGFLKDAECENEDLFTLTSERLYELEPSSESAYNLARLFFFKQKDYDKSKSYYLEAIKGAANDSSKATYYYELGILYNGFLKQPQAAAECATEAANLKSGWGEPYLLMGQAYLAGKNLFSDNFQQQTVFWIAVDMFQKAKSIDSSVAEKASSLINEYSNYFPTKEEIFFQTLVTGQSYTVGGWINKTTTVRAR